jgi:23S rRNA pseudouridine1911/1915/1917 synthase
LDKSLWKLIDLAKNDESHATLKEQFSSRQISKEYTAIVVGIPKKETDTITKPLNRHPKDINKMVVSPDGKEAITEYNIIRKWQHKKENYSMMKVKIHTGR